MTETVMPDTVEVRAAGTGTPKHASVAQFGKAEVSSGEIAQSETASSQPGQGEKIRVLFLQSQSYFGADSKIHALWMRHLDRSQFEVHAACSIGRHGEPTAAFSGLAEIPNLTLRPTYFGPSARGESTRTVLASGLSQALPTMWSLARLVVYARQNRIDVVHCTEKPRDAFYGVIVAMLSGARSVIHIHVKAEGWISRLTQWAMRRASALLAISDFVAASLVDMGFERRKVHTVLNAIEPTSPRPAHAGGGVRSEFGIGAGAPLLLIAARIFPWKGHEALIRALPEILKKHPETKLLIVGEDDINASRGEQTSPALKTLAATLSVEEAIVWTGFRTDVPDIMEQADIFVMPSYEEPFGMVFLEAMLAERPVVALDNGGTPEVVQDGKTGLLAPVNDVEALARAVCRLIEDPGLRASFGAEGRRVALTRFSPARAATEAGSFYRSLVKERAGASKGVLARALGWGSGR